MDHAPDWLPKFVAAAGKPDTAGNRYGSTCLCASFLMRFCTICELICCHKCHDRRHNQIRVHKSSLQISMKVKKIKDLINVSDVHRYFFNEAWVVFVDRPRLNGNPPVPPRKFRCMSCGRRQYTGKKNHRTPKQLKKLMKGKYKFCSIGCKMKHVQMYPYDGYYLGAGAADTEEEISDAEDRGGSRGVCRELPCIRPVHSQDPVPGRRKIRFFGKVFTDFLIDAAQVELTELTLGFPCYKGYKGDKKPAAGILSKFKEHPWMLSLAPNVEEESFNLDDCTDEDDDEDE